MPGMLCFSNGVHLDEVIVGPQWRGFALRPACPIIGALHQEHPGCAQGDDDPSVLLPEVLVQQPVDDGIEAAVEIGHVVTGHEQPLWDPGHHAGGVRGHGQADEIQGSPAHGEQHKDHEHGDKVPEVLRLQFGLVVRLHPASDLQHQDPYSQVAEEDDDHGDEEVEDHHGDGVGRADRLREGAGVDAGVVLQGPDAQVGRDGRERQDPDEEHAAERVLVAVQPVVPQAVADVAIAVDGDARDVEDGADDTQAHEEATDLAVQVAQVPAVVQDGCQHQGVRVHGHHQVSHREAHHKDVPCERRMWKMQLSTDSSWLACVLFHGY